MTPDALATARGTFLDTRVGSVRRIAALARAEALLLRRNPMALLNAFVIPVTLVLFVRAGMPPGDAGRLGGATIVTSLTAFTLVSVVYFNLVTALVARRQELVLKRLRTGETRDAEIVGGTAAPAVVVAWGQILIGGVAAVAFFDMPMPTNPGLVLAALLLGTAVFGLLAVVSTALTRTVELAQVTTMPVVLVSLFLSGLLFPLDRMPEPVQRLAQVLPLTAVVDLLHLGLSGTTSGGATVGLAGSFAPAAVPVLFLAAWVGAGVCAARRWFRWEPRR